MTGLLLQGATVIDGTGSAPARATSVLVEGDRITAVGAAADSHGADAEVVNLDGLTLMPGLIDSHTHITLGEPASNDELFHRRSPAYAALVAGYNARRVLRAGVTSILDVDGLFGIGPALRDAIDAGVLEGPTMKAGDRALMTSLGGTAGRMIPDEGVAGYAEVVHDKAEMVRTTRRQVKHGADIIKIHVTGSIPNRPGELQVWTVDELRAVCDTAHDLGVPVVAHCRSAGSTRDAARAGVDIVFHASYMDEEALEAVVEHGVALGPVFTFLANLADYGAKAGATAPAFDVFRNELESTGAMMRRAYDAGVPLLCGSETGFSITPPGEWHAREMEVFVEHLGLTPLEAISCCTKTNAIAVQKAGEVGVIAPDKVADILVVNGDPSNDITVLGDKSRIVRLFRHGREVDLTSPLPERVSRADERVVPWSAIPLTWDLVHP